MVNKATLIGNLGNDPEIRTANNKKEVVSFSIATSDSWKDKETGERKTETIWHNIAIYNAGLVSVVKKYLKKGSKIYLEGKIVNSKYVDDKGIDRYNSKIIIDNFNGHLEFLDPKEK
jgi:single-strand DNA-binding protein